MSADPIRLTDPGSGAPDALRSLFTSGANDLPTNAELARLSAKLGPLLGPAGGGPAPGGSSSSGSLAGAGKIAAVAAALIGGAVLVANLNQEVPSEVPAARPLPAVENREAPREEAKTTPSIAAPTPAVETASATPSAAERPATRPAARSAAELEVELLERARGSLASNPAHALSLTSEHKLRFPGGALAQEREVIAIEALKRLGRSDQASLRADEFAKNYPGSAHRRKLDAGVTR
jgi:hypothetical protein